MGMNNTWDVFGIPNAGSSDMALEKLVPCRSLYNRAVKSAVDLRSWHFRKAANVIVITLIKVTRRLTYSCPTKNVRLAALNLSGVVEDGQMPSTRELKHIMNCGEVFQI